MNDLQAKSTNTLALCPFCGGEADVTLGLSRWGQSYTIHHDALRKCPAEYVGSMQFATEAEAIAAWNTRHVETCENMREKFGYKRLFVCSECGVSFDPDCEINYCPSCGCKVVGE